MQKAGHNLSPLMFWPVTFQSPGDQGALSLHTACISSAKGLVQIIAMRLQQGGDGKGLRRLCLGSLWSS